MSRDISAVVWSEIIINVESIGHKRLHRFFETGNPKGLVGDTGRLRKMLAFIDTAADLEEFGTPSNYGLHQLTGDRKDTWSMTVTKNWRLTFRVNEEGAPTDMELEGLSWLLKCIRR